MTIFGQFQTLVMYALVLAGLGLKSYALILAVRAPAAAFVVHSRWTKTLWVSILGAAVAVNIVSLNPLNMLNLAGVVAAAVFLVEVGPAVRVRRPRGGTGRGHNRYDGWR